MLYSSKQSGARVGANKTENHLAAKILKKFVKINVNYFKGEDSFEENELPKDILETVEELDDNNANDIPKYATETVDTPNTDLPEPLEDSDSTYKADIIHAGGLPEDNTESDQEETNEIDKSKESSIDDDNELKNFIENFEDTKINNKDISELIGEKVSRLLVAQLPNDLYAY